MRPNNYPALLAADAAQATRASSAYDGTNVLYASVQATLAGAGDWVGTVKLQASNDPPTTAAASIHWNDVASAIVTFSANATMLIGKTDCCYQWLRVLYTRTGGSAGVNTITAYLKTDAF